VLRLPATGDEIGECSRFANQGLRPQTKRGPLQSWTTRGDCFFERLPIRGFGQRIIGAGRQEHREIVVIAESLPEITQTILQLALYSEFLERLSMRGDSNGSRTLNCVPFGAVLKSIFPR
jgi:hypothetical protein